MKSIVSSMVGKPLPAPHGLLIPIALEVADDDDDAIMPDPKPTVIRVFLSSDVIADSHARVEEVILTRLKEFRTDFGTKGWNQLISNVKSFLTNTDLQTMHGPHFAFPSSVTMH